MEDVDYVGITVDSELDDYEEDYAEDEEEEEDLIHVRNLDVENERPQLQEPPAKRQRSEAGGILVERNGGIGDNQMERKKRNVVTTVKIGKKGKVAKGKKAAGGDVGTDAEIKLLEADLEPSGDERRTFPEDKHLIYKRSDGILHLNGGTLALPSMRKMSYGSLRVAKPMEYDPGRPSPLDQLSDEMIVKILEYLPRSTLISFAQTCKRMKAISYDEPLWRRVDFGGKLLSLAVVKRVITRGTQVLRMAKTRVTSSPFDATVVSLPKLQYLDLSLASISKECLLSLIGACNNLVKLGLEQCSLDDDICRAVAANGNLQTLHLGMTSGLTSAGLAHLSALKSLQELNLGWVGMTEEMLATLTDGVLASSAASLLKLNLAGCKENLSDDCVAFVLETCGKLNELDISDARKLTAKTIASARLWGDKLESLSTSRCYGIPPKTFLELVDCENLREFSCYGMLKEDAVEELKVRLDPIQVNRNFFSYVARPTVGIKRTSIWNMRTREANPK